VSQADPARALLDAVVAFYDGPGRSEETNAASMLNVVSAELARAVPFDPSPAPQSITASELLAPALRGAPLAVAIEQAAPLFRWRQNPNYNAANMGAAFMADYGYVEFAGPKDALFHAPGIRVGILLLGPGLHYPLHAHPAEEIYHPLTDGGLWRRGDEDWRTVPAGAAIHHPPMMPHETKAADRTLLALYCWRGDTATEARLTG
jgi:hypothetical protein